MTSKSPALTFSVPSPLSPTVRSSKLIHCDPEPASSTYIALGFSLYAPAGQVHFPAAGSMCQNTPLTIKFFDLASRWA